MFNDAIREGQFPVRWIEGPRSGYSQPLFNFYQVGFYYLVEFVHLFVSRLSQSLTLTLALLWWTGAGFMFLWLKRLGSLPAALGALMFALSSYLVQDVFVRAAYPEVAAICIAPAVLWTLDRLLTTGRTLLVPVLASLLCLMTICHLPATLIVSPLLLANVLYLFLTNQAKPASAAKLAAAGVLALGLSAFYVLPALVELKDINASVLTAYDQDYHQHFVAAKELDGVRFGMLGQVSFQLGISQWIVVLLGPLAVAGAVVRKRFGTRECEILVWMGAVGGALFMMNSNSLPIWETLRFLSFIQFPWRFFLVLSIACGALGALLLASVHDVRVHAAIVLAAIALHLPLYYHYQRPGRLIPRDELDIDDPNWRHTEQGRQSAFYQPGYDPIEVTERPASQIERWTIAEGQGDVHELAVRNNSVTLDAQTDAGMRLSINSHYFSGWRIQTDGVSATFAVTPGYDFMVVDVPPGTHRIEARFGETPIRTFANMISLVTAAGVLVLALYVALLGPGMRRAYGNERTALAAER